MREFLSKSDNAISARNEDIPVSVQENVTFDKLSPDQIRDKIKDPKDPIHNNIKRTVMFFFKGYNYDPASVDDVVQEVSLKIWKSADSFNSDSSLDTWIYRIAYNFFIDHIRKNTFRRIGQLDSLEGVEVSDLSDERQRIDLIDNERFFNFLKTKITPYESQLLEMRYVEDLRVVDIAEKLGKSEETLKVQFFRLFQKIRKIKDRHDRGIKKISL